MDSHFVSNPMGEFMSHGEDVVEEMYSIYKQQHGKIHSSKHEHVKRKHLFRHNMRCIILSFSFQLRQQIQRQRFTLNFDKRQESCQV